MATGDETPPGDRPRWSFTALIRLQRVGRNRQAPPPDTGRWYTHPILWILLAIVGLEALLLVALDVLPLN